MIYRIIVYGPLEINKDFSDTGLAYRCGNNAVFLQSVGDAAGTVVTYGEMTLNNRYAEVLVGSLEFTAEFNDTVIHGIIAC